MSQDPGAGTPESGDAASPAALTATDAPKMSPAPGTYALCHPDFVESVTVPVTLTAKPGAAIYYTTDGTTPTAASARYTGPIALHATTTVRAVAVASGASSAVASGTYTIAPVNAYGMVADPTISPAMAAYASAQTVTLSDPTPGAVIYYAVVDLTASGSGGPEAAPFTVYTGPFTVDRTSVVEAYAATAGSWCSPAFQGDWLTISKVAPPGLAPSGAYGTCDGTFQAFAGDITPGATVHYTTDGSTPSASSPSFPSAGITVQEGAQVDVRALATLSGLSDSDVVERSYSAYQDWNACWQFVF